MEYELQMQPSRYDWEPDQWKSDTVVQVYAKYVRHNVRCAVGYVGSNGSARQVFEGPIVSGPWAYLVPLPVSIDNYGGSGAERKRNQENGLEFDVNEGDVLVICGMRFTIEDSKPRVDYPQLVLTLDS